MIRTSAAIAALVQAAVAFAQSSPPTYQADPSVYKLIFEDENFRVIAATWKKGTHDKEHAHPTPSVAYAVTDCALKVITPDGKSRDVNSKAGSANSVPMTQSHHTENVGASDCQVVFVERK
jgi:quercetin dioxygenase-like cupin family protein